MCLSVYMLPFADRCTWRESFFVVRCSFFGSREWVSSIVVRAPWSVEVAPFGRSIYGNLYTGLCCWIVQYNLNRGS